MWTWTGTFHIAVGKGPEARKVLEDITKRFQAIGLAASFGQFFVGTEGNDFIIAVRCESLAEVEKGRKGMLADTQVMDALAKLSPLLRAPTNHALIEVLIPAPR